MKKYSIEKYQNGHFEQWNDFVAKAKNATFLFDRNFMEYHSARFEDFSVLIYEQEKLVAVLPANKVGSEVHSHQGLTYGGLVFMKKFKTEALVIILDDLLLFLKENSITSLYYKPVPSFYFSNGNAEMDFLLLKKNTVLERKEMNLAINLQVPFQISKSKLKHYKRSQNSNLEIREEENFEPFFNAVLIPRLTTKFGVKPVHTLQEITLLKKSFPNQIKQFSVYFENKIIAGITIFEFATVVKSQYGATTQDGEINRALDFLFITLIEKYQKLGKHFFDMGVVIESNSKGYNAGLLQQKQELGCSVFSQDFYKMSL